MGKYWFIRSRWRRCKDWFFHVCRDCEKVDRIFGLHVGRHRFEDDTRHIPF